MSSPPSFEPIRGPIAPISAVPAAPLDPAATVQSETIQGLHGVVVARHVYELHPHPSYARHGLGVSADKLSALAELGDLAFREPLVITGDGTIVDGYARWELARLKARVTLPCLEYQLTDEESLSWLILRHLGSKGLNDFRRICLALDLEPHFREKALFNPRAGGQAKGSSKLTEDGIVDVRSEIAKAAGVCEGNITKVKQLIPNVHPAVLAALRDSEIRIHRAWIWSRESPEAQIELQRQYRAKKGLGKTLRKLVGRHKSRRSSIAIDPVGLIRRLSALDSDHINSTIILVIPGKDKAVFVTESFVQSLPPHQEVMPPCATTSR